MTNCILSDKPRTGRHGLRAALIGVAALMCLLFFSMPANANEAGTFNAMVALANKGDAEAQYHVGMMYNNGIGTQRDIRQAFEWFQKSTASNDPLGAYKLGCYYDGQGEGVVANDKNEALKYKLIAAKAGYSLAQHDVALLYARQENFEEAMKWWKLAGDQGLPRRPLQFVRFVFSRKRSAKRFIVGVCVFQTLETGATKKSERDGWHTDQARTHESRKTGFRMEATTNSSDTQGNERCHSSRRTLKNHQELSVLC